MFWTGAVITMMSVSVRSTSVLIVIASRPLCGSCSNDRICPVCSESVIKIAGGTARGQRVKLMPRHLKSVCVCVRVCVKVRGGGEVQPRHGKTEVYGLAGTGGANGA